MKFVLPALLLALTALLGSPAWAETPPVAAPAAEAGGGDATRVFTNEVNESADLEDARSRVATIWSEAQKAPKFAATGAAAPAADELALMNLEALKESAFLASQASIDAAKNAADEMTVNRNGQPQKIAGDGTKNAIAASAGFLQQALEDLRRGETGRFDELAQSTVSEMGVAKDGIAKLDQTQAAGRVAGLKELLSHADIALEVVSQTRGFISNPTLGPPEAGMNSDGVQEAEGSDASIIDKIRGVFTLGNTFLFFVLIGWAVTAYWGLGNRSRYLKVKEELVESKRAFSDAELELSHKGHEIDRLESAKRAADARAQELKSEAQASQSSQDEDAYLQRRPPAPPPPPRSKVPDLKREIDAYLSSGGRLKQSDYRAILTSYGSLYGLAASEDGTVILQDDESTQQRHVTAVVVGDTGEVAIVPSAYFVSRFSMQFTSELQLSSETKAFFDIGSGIPKRLSVDSVGSAQMLDSGTVIDIRKGSLSGFELA